MNKRRTAGEVPGNRGSISDPKPAIDQLNARTLNCRAKRIITAMPPVALARISQSHAWQTLRNHILTVLVGACLGIVAAQAQDATWLAAPGSGDWNTAANWAPAAVPAGTATFDVSNTTTITLSAATTVGALQFNTLAPAYTFNLVGTNWAINGSGIVNNSSFSPTITNSGGTLEFLGSSTAANALIVTTGSGVTEFQGTSSGGQARFITTPGGVFDISLLSSAGMTAGSIGGAGTYQLGSKALTVGGNNFSATVSGNIVDGGIGGGVGGSLIKVGTGTLFLNGANTYTGATTVGVGTLEAGSNTGFSQNSAFTVNSELDLNGFSNTVASLAGTGTVTNYDEVNAATLTAGGDNSGTTFSGNMSDGPGVLGFAKAGTGTMILTGANTYSGGTTISGGTLQIGNGGSTGSITGGVVDDANFAFNLTSNQTFAGVVSGTGTLTQAGTGALTLTGANTYSGGTNFNAGILAVASDSNLGSGNLTFNGGTLETTGSDFASAKAITLNSLGGTILTDATLSEFSGPIGGAGSLTKSGVQALFLTGTDTYTGGTIINSGTLFIGDGGTSGSITGNVLDNGSMAFDRTDAVTFGGSISGNGSLQQLGTGTLTLTGVNTFSGGLQISQGGAIRVDNSGELGAGTIFLLGGELETSANFTSGRPLASLAPGPNILAAAAGTTATYSGAVSGGNGLVVGDATNSGTVVFSNVGNSYTGGTTVTGAATLSVGSDSNLGNVSGGIILAGGELLTTLNDFDSSRTVDVAPGGGTLAAVSGSTATYTGVLSDTGALTIGAGTIAGTVVLSGINTYSGGTILNRGVLAVSSDSNLGTSGLTIANNAELLTTGATFTSAKLIGLGAGGGTLAGATATTATYGGVISGTGPLGIGAGTNQGTIVLSGMNTYGGGTTISGGTLQIGNGGTSGSIVGDVIDNGNLAFNRSDTVTFSGNVSGSGSLSKIGAGIQSLSGINTYFGVTTVSVGTLEAASATAFSPNSAFTVNSELDLNGHSNTVGSLAGTGTVSNYDEVNAATLTAGGNNFDTTFTGSMGNGPGTLGFAKAGTGTMILTGTNTYSGGTTINGGTLQIGNGGTSGSIVGDVIDSGNLAFNHSDDITFAGAVSSTGTLNQNGTGTLILTGANTYSGGTTINAGTLQVGAGGTTGSIVGDVTDNGSLVFNRSDALTFAGAVSGTGSLNQNGPGGGGTLILTGTSTYTGATTVSAGTLQVDGVLGNTAVTVQSNTALAGHGTIGGSVTIQDGGHLAPGPGAQTLGVGNLILSSGSFLDYVLSTPGVIGSGVNTLVTVGGNLTLAGVLNVTNGDGFGSGAYRLFNYGGTLTDNGLSFGTSPAGLTETVTTGVPGQVNLVVSSLSAPTQFWDGPQTTFDPIGGIHGGTGTWDNFTTNFTNGTTAPNQSWQNGVAVFASEPGTVTLGDDILYEGMQFESDGYTVVGAGTFALHPTGLAMISTDPGVTATIAAPIVGPGGLNKTGDGLLALTGQNTYSGGTTISAGTLQIGNGGTSGSIVGDVLDNSAFAFNRSDSSNFAGDVSGTGSLSQVGAGTATLTGTSTYSGTTTVSDGTLIAGSVAAFSPNSAFTVNSVLDLNGFSNTVGSLAGIGTVTNGSGPIVTVGPLLPPLGVPATLTAGGDGTSTIFSGVLIDGLNALGLTKAGVGTLILTGTNTYSGGTTVSAGILQIGNGDITGSIVGNVIDNAALVVNRTGTLTLAGIVSGAGTLSQVGTGTLVLTGTNTFTGATSVSAGTLQIDGALGNTAVTVLSGATLAGQGTIGGDVTILNGGHLAPGPGAQTLGVGSLTLNSGSNLDYQLSTPGVIGSRVNSLVSVTGNLTLAGVLNVTDGGQFGSGSYRLINYGGTLTDLTLDLGSLPTGFSGANVTVTTAVTGQVNLVVNAAGAPTQFWVGLNTASNGVVDGGSGTWDNFATNFTNGTVAPNQAWQNGVAVFTAAPGTVTLGADILFQGMQFSSTGYTIAGAGDFALHPTGMATITTDLGMTATISAPIVGPGGLNKAGSGLLILAGENSYGGGTTISGGALRVSSDTNLGAAIVGLVLNGGELESSVDFATARAVALANGNGANTLAAAASTTATYTGVISGAGGLTVGELTNPGTVVLTNINNSYTGGTTVSGATLSVADDARLGDLSGGLTLDGGELAAGNGFSTLRSVALTANGGTLAVAAGGEAIFSGNLTGNGNLTIGDAVNTGTIGLGGNNSYLGSTTIVSGVTLRALSPTALSPTSAFVVTGTLDVNGFSNRIGSLAGIGTVTNGDTSAAVLTVGDNTSTTFSGVLQDGTDPLGLTKVGTGTLTLTGINTYSDDTTISVGRLLAGSITAFSPNSAFMVDSVLDLHGFSNTVGSLAGNGTVTNGTAPNNGIGILELIGTPAILTAGGNGTSTVFSGTLIDGFSTLGLIKIGGGTMTLTGANTYTGGTTISAGTLQIGNGADTGSIVGDVIDNAALLFNRSGPVTFAGVISGTGVLSQVGTGTLDLTGISTYTGTTAVSAGTLEVNGTLGNTAVTVQSGATLAGQGTIGGSVTVLDGGHLAESSVAQTLSVGSLLLNSGSILDYQLSTPGVVGSGVNTLVNVGGDLTLDGVINVTNGGSFGSGSYRLLNYGGALTNLTLDLGTLPVGFTGANTTVTTAVVGQVNLVVNAAGAPVQFWDGSNTVNDGTVHGGTGTWINFVTNNFTNVAGTVNEAWQNGFAIFSAEAGTVTLGGDILFQGMQFSTDGYSIEGADAFALHPTGTAMIITDSGVTATIDAPIVGLGGLNKVGPGLLTLTGANTYSGGTTISGGALSVASDTNLGDPSGGLTLDGGALVTSADFTTARTVAVLIPNPNGTNILAAAANTTATYTGLISGPGGLTVGDIDNPGTVVFTNPNNSYAGGTNVLPGTLVAAATDTLGTGPVQLLNGTLMILAGVTLPNEVTFVEGGVLNNAGTLNNNVLDAPDKMVTVINSGTINGNVTIAGSSDIVQLFTGSKITGDLVLGAAANNSTLILDGAGQESLSAAVVGTVTNNGTLVKQGTGTWTIDRALDAPSGTDILAGTLVVDAVLTTAQVNVTPGGVLQLNSGGSVGNLVDNGSFIFAGSGTVTFDAVISGTGNVVQNGPGTTILSGRNTYSGGTIIDLGTLLVDNAQALGTGDVIVNGGVLGADPQPINVLGNYTQNAGGTLQLNIAGRNAGQFDVLNVTGNAALNGTLRLLNLGYQPQNGDKLKLVNTGGVVSGRFAQFQNPFALAAGFNTIDLVYARQSVTLEFLEVNGPPAVVSTTDFASFAFTPNQRAAANLLDAVQLDPGAANLISFLDKQPFASLPADFNKISPDGLTAFDEISFSNANIQRLNLESRMDDLHHGSNGFSSNMKVNGATVNLEDRADADGKSSKAVVEPILQQAPENRWGVWMTGFGDFVNVDGDGNAQGYNFTTGGVSLGIDYRITDQLAIGVVGEYSHTWTSLKPSGHIDVDSGRGGLYATWYNQGFYLNGAIYGGHNNYDSGRAGLGGLANGSTEGAEWSTFVGGGYDFHFGPLTVGPIASLQYTDVGVDSFSEKGSLAPLAIHSGSADSLRSDAGFRVFYQWQIGKIVLEPSLKATWEHEYKYSALPVTAGFAGVPGPSDTFSGPSEGHDSAVVSAGISVQVTPTITTYLNYDGQLGRGNYDSNAVTGGLRISF